MAEYIQVISQGYYPSHAAAAYTQSTLPIYGTVTDADNYFNSKLGTRILDWIEATYDDKMRALREATQILETLNFKGVPVNDQLHFPTNELGMPAGIAKACYEIALKLLSGIDPDTEVDNLASTHRQYAGARTVFDRSYNQEHIRAGVPSARAWTILRPYLCDPENIRLSRGD